MKIFLESQQKVLRGRWVTSIQLTISFVGGGGGGDGGGLVVEVAMVVEVMEVVA